MGVNIESGIKKLSPFDIAGVINSKSGRLDMRDVAYPAFIVNRVFSNTMDSVLFANEMNRYANLTTQQQFDFYYYGLDKKKRYGKWHKNQEDEDDIIALIQEVFSFSARKAKDCVNLLRPSIDVLREYTRKGGLGDKRRNLRGNV